MSFGGAKSCVDLRQAILYIGVIKCLMLDDCFIWASIASFNMVAERGSDPRNKELLVF